MTRSETVSVVCVLSHEAPSSELNVPLLGYSNLE
jgi:hypothetical protein